MVLVITEDSAVRADCLLVRYADYVQRLLVLLTQVGHALPVAVRLSVAARLSVGSRLDIGSHLSL